MNLELFAARVVALSCFAASLSAAQILVPDRPTTVTVMSDAPGVNNLTVTGTPTVATVSWQHNGAARYTVSRSKDGDAVCCNSQSGDVFASSLTNASWVDNGNGTGIQWSGTYTYTVTAWTADGHYGQTTVKWTRPEPANPTGFTAKQTGEGAAALSWQAVPNASYYTVWGPGAPTEGMRVNGTATTLSGLGAGAKEWSITTRYDPAGVLLPQSSWPKAQLNMTSMTGMYRITLNGFQVVAPAKEALVTLDGSGSEVFALAYVRAYDRATGAVLNEGPVESAVHGDTEGFAGRVPAGSAKSTGGLLAGDKFPGATPWARGNSASSTTFPLLLWEGPLTNAKEAVVVTPMIFEWNGTAGESDRGAVGVINNDQKENSANLWSPVSSALAGPAQTWNGPTQIPLTWLRPAWMVMAGSNNQDGLEWYAKIEERTHAIGADTQDPSNKKHYLIKNTGIVFTRELIEKALNATSQIGGMGPGIIEVKWIEKFPGGTGSYTLYVQVARQ